MVGISGIKSSVWPELPDKWQQLVTIRYIFTLYHLFFTRKFLVHRLMGLGYLLQYVALVVLYFYDYQQFKNSPLVITLPVCGVLQSISAALTFTFLPKTKVDSGYFSNKAVLSYPFIVENSFFAGLLCFQWLYYNDYLFEVLKSTMIVENVFVFLPYVFRPIWPKTSFRDTIRSHENKAGKNAVFFYYSTWVTKIFYTWAKHMIGYYLNYIRFLDRAIEEQIYHIHLLLIFGCFATTIALFLHTLKFKGYIGPKTAFLIYMTSYLATFYSFFKISETFLTNCTITALAALGIPMNFCGRKVEISYQVLLMVAFNAKRYGMF